MLLILDRIQGVCPVWFAPDIGQTGHCADPAMKGVSGVQKRDGNETLPNRSLVAYRDHLILEARTRAVFSWRQAKHTEEQAKV
jgi:hypothetical protein